MYIQQRLMERSKSPQRVLPTGLARKIVALSLLIVAVLISPCPSYADEGLPEGCEIRQLLNIRTATFAVTDDDSLYVWGGSFFSGKYEEYHLSSGGTTSPVKLMNGVKKVDATWDGLYIVKTDGSLLAMGKNTAGELGTGMEGKLDSPQQILDDIVDVATQTGYTDNDSITSFAIGADGSLWGWGDNANGEIGNGTNIRVSTPVKVLDDVKEVYPTNLTTFALDNSGVLWGWGHGYWGQLGKGDNTGSRKPVKIIDNITSFSTDGMCCFAVRSDGSLWSWGSDAANDTGLLGQGEGVVIAAPKKILDGVASVKTNGDTALALTLDGMLYEWGESQLGLSTEEEPEELYQPTKVLSNIVDFDICGGNTDLHIDGGPGFSPSFAYAIDKDGMLWGWGDDRSNQLLDGTGIRQDNPVQVASDIAKVYIGPSLEYPSRYYVLKQDGSLWGWGDNPLGDGTSDDSSMPVQIMAGPDPSEDNPGGDDAPGDDDAEYDAWSFRNSVSKPFSPGWNGGQGYFVTQSDYDRLMSNLPAAEKQKISFAQGDAWLQYLEGSGITPNEAEEIDKPFFNVDGNSSFYRKWAGSCAGMSLWTALVDNDILSADNLPGAPDSLASAVMNDDIASAINYYQGQQLLDYFVNYRTLFTDMSNKDQVNLFEDLIGNGSTDARSVLIDVSWFCLSDIDDSEGIKDGASSHAHALIGYNLEHGNYTSEAQEAFGSDRDSLGDTEFTGRVKLYDPNQDAEYLYFNDDGVWCLPSSSSKHRIISRGNDPVSKTNNGCFRLITSVGDSQNLIDYRTGEITEGAVSATEDTYLTYDPDYQLSIEWENDHHVIITHTIADPAFDVVDIFVPTDKEGGDDDFDVAEATAVLPVASSYAVDSMGGRVDYRLSAGDYYLVAASNTSGTAAFGTSGNTSVSLDKPGTIYLNVTANEGHTALPWTTIEVVSDDASEVSAELTSNGVLVSGDGLDGATVYGSKDDETEIITLNTNEDTVLVAEDEDGELTAFGDLDGDGTYETDLSDGGFEPIELTSENVASIPDQAWTGKPVCPKPVVTVGGATLVEGTDYTCSYENNVNPGIAAIVVTGQGAYTGSVRVEFQIVRHDVDVPDRPTGPTDPGTTDPDDPDTPEPEEPWDNPFADVAEGDWFYDAVRGVYDLGIMHGYGDGSGKFGPLDVLTREQAAAVMYNYLGDEAVTSPAAPHADVAQGQWYSTGVNWAVSNEVMRGYGNGSRLFGIGDELTREQFAAVIANAAKANVDDVDVSAIDSFSDTDGVSEWARKVMAWAVENGIINGVSLPDGTRELRATSGITRAEIAAEYCA